MTYIVIGIGENSNDKDNFSPPLSGGGKRKEIFQGRINTEITEKVKDRLRLL